MENTENTAVKVAPVAENAKPQENRAPRRDRKFSRAPRRDRSKDLLEQVISVNRVSKTVKGGRRMKFSVLVAVGDGKGQVGFGTGKANEVPDAIKKALDNARKNLVRVTIVRGDTISHETMARFGACKVFLKPAKQGAGVIAGGPVRAIMELAGIKNIYSKVYGSRTSINMVRATVDGLTSLKSFGSVARLRGKSIKDIK